MFFRRLFLETNFMWFIHGWWRCHRSVDAMQAMWCECDSAGSPSDLHYLCIIRAERSHICQQQFSKILFKIWKINPIYSYERWTVEFQNREKWMALDALIVRPLSIDGTSMWQKISTFLYFHATPSPYLTKIYRNIANYYAFNSCAINQNKKTVIACLNFS